MMFVGNYFLIKRPDDNKRRRNETADWNFYKLGYKNNAKLKNKNKIRDKRGPEIAAGTHW